MIKFASSIVESIANEIRRLSKQTCLGHDTGQYGAGGDKIKFGDICSTQILEICLNEYLSQYPNNKVVVIAEESGIQILGNPDSKQGVFLIIDPLDGSNNLRNWRTPNPAVSVSVAIGYLEKVGEKVGFDLIEAGAVVDIFGNLLYTASRGEKAYEKNFGVLTPSPLTDIKDSIVGIDLDMQGRRYDSLFFHVDMLLRHTRCQRRLGSSILDFIKVASGEYDAFVSMGGRMKIYDIAAAKLIVEEAGGVFEIVDGLTNTCPINELICTQDNALLTKFRYRIVASGNPKLHTEIKDMIS